MWPAQSRDCLDIVLQRHRLQAATAKVGLDVCFSGDPERLLGYPEFPAAGLWLVTLEDEADHPALFDHLLENTDAPVLFGLDPAPKPGGTDYFRWERRLLSKLEDQLGDLEELDSEASIEQLDVQVPATATPPTLPHWITPATQALLPRKSGFSAPRWVGLRRSSRFSITCHRACPLVLFMPSTSTTISPRY